MNDYGSLRSRTRDSGWQWMLMGAFLGLGLAMVVCVGAYAVGAISLSALESDDEEPDTVIVPNDTEVAMQTGLQETLAAQQATIDAQAALLAAPQDMTEPVELLPDGTGAEAAPPAAETPQATASPLPDGDEPVETPAETPIASANTPAVTQPGTTPLESAAEPQTGGPAGDATEEPEMAALSAPQGEAAGLTEDTLLQGTPVQGLSSPTPGFGSAEIDPRLEAIASELVPVNGGSFTMGTTLDEANAAVDECALYDKECDVSWTQDSIPAHQVTVDPYQIEVTEVTVDQYVAFLNWMGPDSHKAGCLGQPCVNTTQEQPETSYIDFDGEQYSINNPQFYTGHPVTQVTWWGAEAYCNAIGRRLPTEAEWEHAARGPNGNIYPWGSVQFDPTLAMSSVNEASGTVPVDEYSDGDSPYGALNMAGNVEEWVADWYSSTYYSDLANNPNLAVNPQGPLSGTERVLRGGSWDTVPLFLRTVHRRSQPAGEPTAAIGFRCVSDEPSQVPLTSPGGDTSGSGLDTVPSGAPTMSGGAADTSGQRVPTATLAPG